MKKIRVLALLNALAFVVANAISYLSNTKIFFDKTIGMVSDKYDALFVPAGFTFSIWGLIYLSLYGFTIYHLVKAFKSDTYDEANRETLSLSWLFAINNIATTAWVFAWISEMLLVSVLLMLLFSAVFSWAKKCA